MYSGKTWESSAGMYVARQTAVGRERTDLGRTRGLSSAWFLAPTLEQDRSAEQAKRKQGDADDLSLRKADQEAGVQTPELDTKPEHA